MPIVEELLELEDTSTEVVDFAPVAKKKNTTPSDSSDHAAPPSKASWQKPVVIVALLAVAVTLWIHLDSKFGSIQSNLTDMSSRIGKLEGRFDQIDADQKKLNGRLEQQDTINLDSIRTTIEIAEKNRTALPATQLATYKNVVLGLQSSPSKEFWVTVAAIINYESLLNQIKGGAPNPEKVSKPCAMFTNEGGLHSFHNEFIGIPVSNCVVDLDSQKFSDVTFTNSVVRYHGGPFTFHNVKFVNCRFVLELKSAPSTPDQKNLLLALLGSDQKTVQISR